MNADLDAGKEIVARAIQTSLDAGASEADAILFRGRSLEARVRDKTIDFVKQSDERVLGIRALVAGREGRHSATTSTSDLELDSVEQLARDTVSLARSIAPDPAAGLPEGGFAEEIPDLGLLDPADADIPVESRIEDAQQAETAARSLDPRITNSEGSQVGSDFSSVVYGNSVGFLAGYESAAHSLYSEPIASEGDVMQRDYWMTVGRQLSGLQSPAAVGEEAARRALERLRARRVPTAEVPVLFESRQAAGLLRQLAALISGYAIYRETSFLTDQLGKSIAPESVTIIDDGRLPGGLGSKPFDGEGLATRRNVLVDRGRLDTWLLDSYSARKLGLESTGNASRGPGGPPGVSSTNLWLEPGDASLDELIADTPRGLLVTELMGMGFNPVTGDYSRGASGLWIEGGEIAHPVEEITIAGNFGDMLRDIDAVGSDLQWLGSVASPSLRIASMTVAGE